GECSGFVSCPCSNARGECSGFVSCPCSNARGECSGFVSCPSPNTRGERIHSHTKMPNHNALFAAPSSAYAHQCVGFAHDAKYGETKIKDIAARMRVINRKCFAGMSVTSANGKIIT